MPHKSNPGDQVIQGVLVFNMYDKYSPDERIRSGAPQERSAIDHPMCFGGDLGCHAAQSQGIRRVATSDPSAEAPGLRALVADAVPDQVGARVSDEKLLRPSWG